MQYNRRLWLQQSFMAFAGLTVGSKASAANNQYSYASASPPGAILLNANENPYGPSRLAQKAIMDNYLQMNRYPDDYISPVQKKIAAHWGVEPSNILMGAGSSEIIGLALLHASLNKKKIITAEPGYKVWNGQAASMGMDFTRIPLTNERKTDLSAMAAAIDGATGMVYICNPNNPTGTFVEVAALKNFTVEAAKKTLVFIDEAYTEYANLASLATLAITNTNIIVAKTFSKIYGLAGARVGYAIAHADTIKKLATYQPWPNASVSVTAVAAAMASLDDVNFVNHCRIKNEEAKKECYETFHRLSLDHIPSATNFILFSIDPIKKDLVKEMEARNIFLQYRGHFGGKWCRVTVGTNEEMKAFCKALTEIV